MVKENMFNVEKHLNDTIHNPQARGRSHTEREVQAAGRVLGREAPPPKPTDEERLRQRGEALGDGAVLLQQRGLVMRVDTSTLPKDPKRRKPKAPAPVLDGYNRGNMMTRIQAGGTGGNVSGAAAAYLSSNRAGSDEDEPVLVLEEDMVFEGGFAALPSTSAERPGEPLSGAGQSARMADATGGLITTGAGPSPGPSPGSSSTSSESEADRRSSKKRRCQSGEGSPVGHRKSHKQKRHRGKGNKDKDRKKQKKSRHKEGVKKKNSRRHRS